MRRHLKAIAQILSTRLFQRDLFILPKVSNGFSPFRLGGVLPLQYAYRASPDGRVSYRLLEAGQNFEYRLHAAAFQGSQLISGEECLLVQLSEIKQGTNLEVDLLGVKVWLNGKVIPAAKRKLHTTRKFIAELRLKQENREMHRVCSHYLPFENKAIGRDYFFGDDYVDYLLQTGAAEGLAHIQRYCSNGRLLDVGCALGIYTKAFLVAGFDAYGIDISEFAVAEARKIVGEERVQQVNLDESDIPFYGSFDVFWMWDVLEHSASPYDLLKKVTDKAAPEALLFLHTSNADSLMRRIMGQNWEGYSDYSHYGVDLITASSLAEWLRQLGWNIVTWDCSHIWADRVDPVMNRLRDAFLRIPELRIFLNERNLGDMVTVVARKGADK